MVCIEAGGSLFLLGGDWMEPLGLLRLVLLSRRPDMVPTCGTYEGIGVWEKDGTMVDKGGVTQRAELDLLGDLILLLVVSNGDGMF